MAKAHYTNPPDGMHCTACGRTGRSGERQGDTCGLPIDKTYRPLSDDEYADMFLSLRRSMPLPSSHPASIAREQCVGVLLYPVLSDPW